MSVVSQTDFNRLMADFNLPAGCVVAVGVSGGADSLFLTIMMQKWALKTGHKVVALTVNHNLRPEAEAEAQTVSVQMKKYGIEHHILTYDGQWQNSRIEEQARAVRYRLLQDFCATHDIKYLCLAHHASDQAETFFARLARGSGIDGLSAIRPVSERGGLTLIRPVLHMAKRDILDTLKAWHETWAEDPMNKDTAFERVRWRSYLDDFHQMGLSQNAVGLSAKRLNRAREALSFFTDTFIRHFVQVDNRGFATIDLKAYHSQPDEIKLRVLSRLLTIIGQSNVPVSMESLEQILDLPRRRLTLGWCHIIVFKNKIFISKEYVRQEPPKNVPAKVWTRWDRFRVWSDTPIVMCAGQRKKTKKDIPYLVQQSFPMAKYQKTLEKNAKVDYKKEKLNIKIYIEFIPKEG